MNSYHEALSQRSIEVVIRTAQRGWSPRDLLHVLGTYCHPIIYRAAGQVPAHVTSTVLRKDWLTLEPPTSMAMSTDRLVEFLQDINRLPRLSDVEALVAEKPAASSRKGKAERIREKISGLLKKAESTPYEEEASALIAKAQSLQNRCRLEDSDGISPTAFVSRRIHISAPYINHKSTLLSVIADRNGCSALQVHPKGIVSVFGTEEDVQHVVDLFGSLQRQCDWHMRHGDHATAARESGNLASFRRSFILAYAARIGEILDSTNNSVPPASESIDPDSSSADEHSLMLMEKNLSVLDQRRRDAEAVRDLFFPNARTMSLSMGSRMGMSAGTTAADKSHLGGDSAGVNGRRQLTG